MNEERDCLANENNPNEKMHELTEEEAARVSGGESVHVRRCINPSCGKYMMEIETSSRKCVVCGGPMATVLC